MKKLLLLFSCIALMFMSFNAHGQYDIFIYTTDEMGLMAVGEVTVELDGETIVTPNNPMGAEAIFVDKAPGEYPYVAHKDGFATVYDTVTVVDQNVMAFAKMIPAYDIFIYTTDAMGLMSVGEVTVELDGETIVTPNDPMGALAVFENRPAGEYPFTASKDGYATVYDTVTVVDQNPVAFAKMIPAYDIFIYTTDAMGLMSVGEVTVELDGETIVTPNDPMGALAVFENRPAGEYPFTASKDGYATVYDTVTVVDQNPVAFAKMIPAYDIFIYTTDAMGLMSVGEVTVELDGETIVTPNDPMGALAVFENRPAGEYPFTASKDGYATVYDTVTVVDQNPVAFAKMIPAYDIFIYTTDAMGLMAVGEVTVELDGETIVTPNDPMGALAVFENRPAGEYPFTASKDGYATVYDTVTVVDQNPVAFAKMIPAYDIFIYTTDAMGLMSVGEVTVELDGETIITPNDPMGALAVFEEKPAGEYPFTASKDGYATVYDTVTVVDENPVVFAKMIPAYDIFIYTTDAMGLMAVGEVTVELDGETIITPNNPMGAEAIFEEKPAGVYPYTASKEGYATVYDTVTVIDENVMAFAKMVPVYTLTFNVIDGSNPIVGAELTIGEESWTTDAAGEIVLEDIEAGTYDYTITANGYVDATGSVTVIDEDITEIVSMSVPTYSVTFTIVDGSDPIEGANVNFNSTDVSTDASGVAVFTELVAGDYAYTVSNTEYPDSTGTITVVDADVEITIDMFVTGLASYVGSDLLVYPNPVTDYLKVDMTEYSMEKVEITIISSSGVTVERIYGADISNEISIDMSEYQDGMYFLKLQNKDLSKTFRIIKL